MLAKATAYAMLALLLSTVCFLDFTVEKSRPPAPETESVVCALAGEFRTVAANLLWMKAEVYHHEFIRHGGDWNENKDILPLIKLITDLDPHFVEAYLTGAWMLATGLDRKRDALAYLQEGILNNPKSYELYEEVGTLYARQLEEPRKGLPFLEKAFSLARDDFDRKRLGRLVRTVRRICREEESKHST